MTNLTKQALDTIEQLQAAIYRIDGEQVSYLGSAIEAADWAETVVEALKRALSDA